MMMHSSSSFFINTINKHIINNRKQIIAPMASSLFNYTPFFHNTSFTSSPKSSYLMPPRTLNFSTSKKTPIKAQQQEIDKIEAEIEQPKEKRSFAVATGELFIGIAARLIKGSQKNSVKATTLFKKSKDVNNTRFGDDDNSEERIGAVMEDDIEPGVIWEQRVKDIEAENRRVFTGPGFSFSAAGLLFPYHLGVAQYLIENGYIKETTPLAGASAGAIVCAVIASGYTMHEALEATKILTKDCREKGTAFRLGAVLREVLETFLPDDIHIRSSGRVRVAVTQILWRPRGLLVDQFDSKEDLINAVVTSSFIPGYLAPRPATLFRNRLCVDGGLTLFMPPTSASETIRVCAFPASRLGMEGIGISPDCNPGFAATPRQMFNWALEPAEDDMLDNFFELGYQAAEAWAKENPLQ